MAFSLKFVTFDYFQLFVTFWDLCTSRGCCLSYKLKMVQDGQMLEVWCRIILCLSVPCHSACLSTFSFNPHFNLNLHRTNWEQEMQSSGFSTSLLHLISLTLIKIKFHVEKILFILLTFTLPPPKVNLVESFARLIGFFFQIAPWGWRSPISDKGLFSVFPAMVGGIR